MDKVKFHTADQVNPDTLQVDGWGLYCHCQDSDAYPIIYSERYPELGNLFVGDNTLYHMDLGKAIYEYTENNGFDRVFIANRTSDFLVRIWADKNAVVTWQRKDDNIEEIKQKIVKVIGLLKAGNFKFFDIIPHYENFIEERKQKFFQRLDFNALQFYWKEWEEDEYGWDDEFACREYVNDLLHSEESSSKYKEAQNAWIAKFGNIDPAKYHLLMYQENKKQNKIQITENDIRKMVKECIKKLKKS